MPRLNVTATRINAIKNLAVLSLVIASVSSSKPTFAQSVILNDLGGGYSKAFSINNYAYNSPNRIIVGESNNTLGALTPCYWDVNGIHALPVGGTNATGTAYGVNQSGVIVGYVTQVSPPYYIAQKRAVRWVKVSGVYTLEFLGTLGGQASVAYGINDNGTIVGESNLVGDVYHRGFRWIAGSGMIDLGTLGGNNSTARGINNLGYITGSADTTTMTLACRFFPGQPNVSLGTIPGGTGYFGYTLIGNSINNTNKIAGISLKPTASGAGNGASGTIGFFNSPSTAIGWGTAPLSLGAIKQNEAYGVNANGRVVGFSYGNIYPGFAWYADGNVPTKLPVNDPTDDNAEAYGINSSGQLVTGTGSTVVGMVNSWAAVWFLP